MVPGIGWNFWRFWRVRRKKKPPWWQRLLGFRFRSALVVRTLGLGLKIYNGFDIIAFNTYDCSIYQRRNSIFNDICKIHYGRLLFSSTCDLYYDMHHHQPYLPAPHCSAQGSASPDI